MLKLNTKNNKEETIKTKDVEKTTDNSNVDKKPWYKRWYIITTIIVCIVMFIFNYNYTLVLISGDSMEPNYQDSNIVLAEKHYDYLSRFDVVVIASDKADLVLIKRIIGLPGETVEYKDNQLFINGEYVNDIYGSGFTNNFVVELDENSYYCLGDNREHSWDSRKYGSFEKSDIMAKVKGRQHVSLNKKTLGD